MNKLKQQLEEMKNKVAELEKAIEEKENWEWEPKQSEIYFFIDGWKRVGHVSFKSNELNNFNLERRNYYRTKEEAKFALEMYNFCKERSFEPDWGDEEQDKYYLYINSRDKEARSNYLCNNNEFAPFYYPSEDKVREIINRYSADELAKYYGRV